MAKMVSPSKIYIKSSNNYNKIISKYNISLILFIIISLIINVIIGNSELAILLLKSLFISFISVSIISYVINIIKKEYNFLSLYKNDSTISVSIILSIFGINTNIYILLLAILITLIIKNTITKINISSSLYGILIILLYKYLNNELIFTSNLITSTMTYNEVLYLNNGILNYLFSIANKVPVISIIAFIYLFHNKSIKYNIVLSYILTFSLSILLYGLFKGLGIYYGIVEILTSSVLFLSIYTVSDYRITPNISEGNTIYGIILGIVSSILSIFLHEIGIVLVLIITPLCLTKIIDKISPKLKYNNKLYITSIIFLIIFAIISITSISIFL